MLKKYAPGAAAATSAAACIPIVCAKVREATRTWVATGQLTGTAADIAPPGLPGVAADVHDSGAGDTAQAKPDTTTTSRPLAETLGEGRELDASAASAIGNAYGESFGQVRVHTDEKAARFADQHAAHAVTVGSDIAFAKGAYNPGTVEGDALLAHELAHVVQQSGAPAVQLKKKRGEDGDTELALPDQQSASHEADADQAAAGALARIYGGAKSAARSVLGRVGPALTSGFQLQRCPTGGGSGPAPAKTKTKTKSSTGGTDFMKDTHAPTDLEKKDIDKILDPGGAGSTTASKKFKETYFRREFKKSLLGWIHNNTASNKKLLGKDGFDLQMPQVRKTGQAAQEVVTARYGALVQNATLNSGTSARKPGYDVGSKAVLHTQQESVDLLADKADVDAIVRGLIDYAASQEDGGKDVIVKSHYDASRTADKRAYLDVRKSLMTNKAIYKQLVEIQRNWPGEEHPWDGTVYIQLRQFTDKKLAAEEKAGDVKFQDANLRKGYWGTFQTLIHEYLHSCAHGNLQDAANSGAGLTHQILIEGGCDYYTEIVWNEAAKKIPADAALREKVEGKKYPFNPDVIPAPSYYDEKEDVKKIIGKLGSGGAANFDAAYFLGHTEMIGLGRWKSGMSLDEGIYEAPIDKFPLKWIAERSNADEATVAKDNGYKVGDEVPKGTRVKVPGIRWHSCITGDTKADISKQYAITEAALDKANPLATWASLREGEKVLIPVST